MHRKIGNPRLFLTGLAQEIPKRPNSVFLRTQKPHIRPVHGLPRRGIQHQNGEQIGRLVDQGLPGGGLPVRGTKNMGGNGLRNPGVLLPGQLRQHPHPLQQDGVPVFSGGQEIRKQGNLRAQGIPAQPVAELPGIEGIVSDLPAAVAQVGGIAVALAVAAPEHLSAGLLPELRGQHPLPEPQHGQPLSVRAGNDAAGIIGIILADKQHIYTFQRKNNMIHPLILQSIATRIEYRKTGLFSRNPPHFAIFVRCFSFFGQNRYIHILFIFS